MRERERITEKMLDAHFGKAPLSLVSASSISFSMLATFMSSTHVLSCLSSSNAPRAASFTGGLLATFPISRSLRRIRHEDSLILLSIATPSRALSRGVCGSIQTDVNSPSSSRSSSPRSAAEASESGVFGLMQRSLRCLVIDSSWLCLFCSTLDGGSLIVFIPVLMASRGGDCSRVPNLLNAAANRFVSVSNNSGVSFVFGFGTFDTGINTTHTKYTRRLYISDSEVACYM
ncbi:Uncharacterised protein [uncultured archaeon]|nr:Uncharacterised protein [uncultured archaeon]